MDRLQRWSSGAWRILGGVCLIVASASPALAQARRPGQTPRDLTGHPLRGLGLASGRVLSEARFTNGAGGMPDTLDRNDQFGRCIAEVGDLDGDGQADLLVAGSRSLWVLFLAPDDSARSYREVRPQGPGVGSNIGIDALASLGDLDGDGRLEVALGGSLENDGSRGVYILSIDADGSLHMRQRIASGQGGLPPGLVEEDDGFGISLAVLDDLDGDGVVELAVGASSDDLACSGCSNVGSLWILLLDAGGTIHGQQRIGRDAAGLSLPLDQGDRFGSAVAALGDLDGDGIDELAVAAGSDDDGLSNAGAVYVVYLGALGTARASQKISASAGGFVGGSTRDNAIGADSLAAPGDVDGDGTDDLLVGSVLLKGPTGPGDSGSLGGFWVLTLRPSGTVKTQRAVREGGGGFTGDLGPFDGFGSSLAIVGDHDGNGVRELAVGAPRGGFETDFSSEHGALWILRLGAGVQILSGRRITDGDGGLLPDTLDPLDHFGTALASLGDLDGDGRAEVAVGAPEDDDGGDDRGAVWLLSLDGAGELSEYTKISLARGGFGGSLALGDRFGSALARVGDLDGDGTSELAVGAPGDNGSGVNRGAVWILFLRPDGSVARHQKIIGFLNFSPPLQDEEGLGSALAPLGDLDGDGVEDLAVSSPGLNQSTGRGRVWILFLRSDGSLRESREIGAGTGGFGGALDIGDNFGSSLARLGDLDGDGRDELAVGAAHDDDGGPNRGAVWLLSLGSDGRVLMERKLSATSGGFTGTLETEDQFGASCADVGDLDGDGVVDLAVGAPGDDDQPDGAAGVDQGAAWVLFLRPDGRVRTHAKISATAGGRVGPLEPLERFGAALCGELELDGDGVRDLLVGAPNDDGYDAEVPDPNKGAVWRLTLSGIATIGFERGDDIAASALANGRSLTGAGAFARALALTGSGANLGPALFDSAPSGPNDPSQDRDLLVGRGNLLILQNSQVPTQSVPGVFDRPNDDQDGGLLEFRFPRAVAPLSLVLVDIDPGASQHASVRLFDIAGRTRTYAIPAGWTEDLLVHGPPGWRTLALTTIEPQPGFLATATASESPGFLADHVVRLEAELGSSGALDELRFAPHPEGE